MISVHETMIDPKESRAPWVNPFSEDETLWLNWQITPARRTLKEISHCIQEWAWSPSLYVGRIRDEKYFKEAHYVGLDFDGGQTLAWALEEFKDYACVIGTTRSHQRSKVTKAGKEIPASDRFRVVIRLGETIKSLQVFRATMKYLIETYGADKQCKDGARFFFPCSDIVYEGPENGLTIIAEPEPPAPPEYKPREFKPATGNSPAGPAIRALLCGGGERDGERNSSVYRAACSLFSPFHNYSLEQAFQYIKPFTSLDDSEIMSTLLSAKKKAQG